MFRFVTIFLGSLLVLFTLELLQPVQQHVILPFTGGLAHVAVWFMQVFDHTVVSQANNIRLGPTGPGIEIVAGCNGVEAVLILVSAVLAFPSPWKHKLVGVGVGFVAIQALNGSDGGWQNATIVNLNPALALAALTSNSVQAAVLIQPYLAEAVQAGGQVLALGTSYTKGYSYFLAADSALASTKKSAAIADYLHRYAVAEHWAAAHTATWAQDYATANSISLSLATAAVNAALASFVKIGPNQYNSITNEAVAFTRAGLLTTPVDTKTLYTTKFNTLVATFPKG